MTDDYLEHPDEAQHAADYFMKKFGRQGARIGASVSLIVQVTAIEPADVAGVERRVRALFDCLQLEHGRFGLPFFKKPSIRASLVPMSFERANLLAASESLYRLVLDQGVCVKIEMG